MNISDVFMTGVVARDDDYDADFLIEEDLWLYPGCKDASCPFCGPRPVRPSYKHLPRNVEVTAI